MGMEGDRHVYVCVCRIEERHVKGGNREGVE